MRISRIILAMFSAVIIGCESSSEDPPELGSVKASIIGLDGIIELTLNDSDSIRPSGRPSRQTSDFFTEFRRDTAVFPQLLETGEAVEIEVTRQPDWSYCEVSEEQDWTFDAETNSYFTVYCQPFRKGRAVTSSVDISSTHACAILDDTARCFGDNVRIIRVPEEFTEPQLLKAGHGFSCGVQADELFCWGDEEYGFLSFAVPEIVGGIQELELGAQSACLIDEEGLKCWGHESSAIVNNFPQALESPNNLVVREDNACVLEAGNAHCWGGNVDDETLPEDLSSIVDIDINIVYGCAVTESSTVICWPNRGFREDYPPVPEDLGRVSAIAVGLNTACATTDNGLRCWGKSNNPLSLTDRIVTYPNNLVLSNYSGCAIEEDELICFGTYVGGRDQFLLLR